MHWFNYTLNGDEIGEIGFEAAYAGHFNVPVILMTGDDATAIEALETFGHVECAIERTFENWGQLRGTA